MYRISSDSEFLDSGKIVIDADGIPIEPVSKQSFEDALEPKADKSYVDSAVAPKADKSYVDSRTPLRSFVGTGSPEGKVTASVGSVYTDTAATNGAIRWIKTSGTGNTGWLVEYGDTGWRDVTASLEPGRLTVGNNGYFRVRRKERFVEYAIRDMSVVTSGGIFPTPSGFRVETAQSANVFNGSGFFYVSRYLLAIGGVTVGQNLSLDREFVIRFNADPAWPTTLPGTPA